MKNGIVRVLVSLCCMVFINACAPVAREYAGLEPRFELDRFLTGELVGHGMFLDRSGRVKTRFTVEIRGEPRSQGVSLHEVITYVNGDIERRVWEVQKESDNRYIATTPDVNGQATVDSHGFAAQWHYQMKLKVEGDVYNIDFDDWMYYLGDGLMLNRATASKFGFKVGEVLIAFRRKGE